jgi:lysosomal acid phosphatase
MLIFPTTANYASALAIELRRGSPPDVRDFLRIKFKNGTASGFQDVHVFGHHADIPLTEFIYRAEVGTLYHDLLCLIFLL